VYKVMTLGSRLCPPGVEGSMFSLLTSIMNAGSFVSGELGPTRTIGHAPTARTPAAHA
jgi:hypothetical protein